MVLWEMFMYHQNTLKILSLQYVVMFAVCGYLVVSRDLDYASKLD